MTTQVSRRSFLTGAGALGVAAAASALAGQATAFADEAEETVATTAAGTTYSPYENPDEIGIVHEAAASEEFDVVVVGTGISGMLCSMICAEQAPDAKILLIDKRASYGGNTMYAERCAPNASSDWATALADGVATAAEASYLRDGLLIAERAYDYGKFSAWLYLKQGVKLHQPESSAIARPMYEGGNGTAVIERLVSHIEEDEAYANLELRLNTRATALLLEDEYTCVGVQIQGEDGTYTDVSAKAVFLGTGGMGGNFDLLQYYSGQDLSKCDAVGDGQDGDGHLMVEQTAHGRCRNVALSSMYVYVRGLSMTGSMLSIAVSMNSSACYVNQDGIRFMDESSPSDVQRSKAVEQQGKVFSILGTGLLNDYQNGGLARMKAMVGEDYGNEEWDASEDLASGCENMYVADTLEELAELIGVPVEDFVATMEQYEADCEAGEGDTVFGKAADSMMAMGEGPYYAFQLTSVIFNTNSGIRINRNAQVVAPDYTPVTGLYAAGICASGLNTGELYYVGTCQSSGLWGGSKAARHIVENCLGGTVADDWFGDEEYTADSVVEYDNQ